MIDENYQAALGAQARAFNAFLDAIMPLHVSDAPTPEPVDPGRQPGSEPEMTPPEPESPAAEEPPAEEPTP